MTKNEAIDLAAAHDVAVYKGDTIAKIIARINSVIEARNARAAELAAYGPAHRLAPYARRRIYRHVAAPQMSLAFLAPRDWSSICGIVARA